MGKELLRGTAMLKFPSNKWTVNRSAPHFKYVQLMRRSGSLWFQWWSKKKKMSKTAINIRDIIEIREGQETEVFKRFDAKTLRLASFSIIYGNNQTLDLVAKSIPECKMWVMCLNVLVREADLGKKFFKEGKKIHVPVK